MKKPVVDYRKFRFSKLRDPEYRHMLLLLGWVGYFLLYVLTENLIPPERCHVIHCALDDKIPFCELFLIPYTFWYLLVAGSLLYFFLYDIPSFRTLSIFIIITQVVAMTAYIFYPSIQLLRPETFPRDNLLTRLMAFIYTVDTPTGVCPSLHVAYSVGIASTWCKARSVPRWSKPVVVALAILISIATTFVKQHSVVDILAALPVCVLAELLVFGSWWKARLTTRRG